MKYLKYKGMNAFDLTSQQSMVMRKTEHQIYSKFISGVVLYESVSSCLDADMLALITRLQVANCD